jgi:putative NADPH-quinone reductase
MSRNLLLLCLHPAPRSLSSALADAYAEGAAAHPLRRHDLATLRFDAEAGQAAHDAKAAPEDDIEALLADLDWCRHLVIFAPMWWGGLPARAKGLIDRMFQEGRAFDPSQRRFGQPKPLLTGRSARLVLTSNTPDLFFRLVLGQPLRRQMASQVLGFVGIRPMAFTHLSRVEAADEARRASWLAQMRRYGAAAA